MQLYKSPINAFRGAFHSQAVGKASGRRCVLLGIPLKWNSALQILPATGVEKPQAPAAAYAGTAGRGQRAGDSGSVRSARAFEKAAADFRLRRPYCHTSAYRRTEPPRLSAAALFSMCFCADRLTDTVLQQKIGRDEHAADADGKVQRFACLGHDLACRNDVAYALRARRQTAVIADHVPAKYLCRNRV